MNALEKLAFLEFLTVVVGCTQAYDTNTEAAEALRTHLCKRDASQPKLPFTMSGADYLAGIVPRTGVRLIARPAPSQLELLLSEGLFLYQHAPRTRATIAGTQSRELARVRQPQKSGP